MKGLDTYFDDVFHSISAKPVVTIIGTGGKTSLLWKLAQGKRDHKTLVTTTTHIGRPRDSDDLYDYFFDENSLPVHAEKGVTLIGNTKNSGCASLPLETLEQIIPLYDYVFIEGDGSRGLPLKAWAAYEPVVTGSTSITVGILPLWTLGMPINEHIIHRLPLFLELTGAKEGDALELKHLVDVITGNASHGGLFKHAVGEKILFFNQVEDDKAMECAKALVGLLPEAFTNTFLYGIIAGSVLPAALRAAPQG
jgi:probable selenium-dependent hydroxylase accessory protein YqeC